MKAGDTVLVVEDNERNMKLVRDVLEASGYQVFEAATGEDALELAVAHVPSVVLVDVHLPGIDGVETLACLRRHERTAAIPVVAVTAQAMRGDRERLLEAGFTDYLPKPLDINELVTAVRRLCAGGVGVETFRA